MRRIVISSAAPLIAAGLNPWACAAAQTVAFGTTIEAGVGVATNPYNDVASRGLSAAASLDVRPDFTIRGETTELKVEGLVHLRQFAKDYGLEDNYGLNARWSRRATDGLSLRANAGFAYSQSGFNAIFPAFGNAGIGPGGATDGDLGGLGGVVPIGPIGDVDLIGGRSRISAFDAGIGADYRFSASDAVSADSQFRALRFSGGNFSEYNFASQELRYSRILSERTTLGAIGQVATTDYLAARGGDARTLSVLGSVIHRLNSRWVVDLSAGAARTHVRGGPVTPSANFTSLSLRGSLCKNSEGERLCFDLRRSPQPTVNGGVRNSGTIGIDYSRRLSARDQIRASAAYSRTGPARAGALALGPTEYVGGNVTFDRRFNERLSGFISGSYQRTYDSQSSRRGDVGVNVGVRMRFGSVR